MIEINLLPSHLRKKEGAGFLSTVNIPKEILFGLGGLVLTLLVLIHVALLGVYTVKWGQEILYKITWQKMLPDKNNIDSIAQSIRDLKAKISTIDGITSKKTIFWSQKLNTLSDISVKGIWFKKMTWDNNVLTVEGNAFSKLHDEMTLVGNFVANLKKEEDFTKDFSSIELVSVSRSKKGMTEVVDFKITAKAK